MEVCVVVPGAVAVDVVDVGVLVVLVVVVCVVVLFVEVVVVGSGAPDSNTFTGVVNSATAPPYSLLATIEPVPTVKPAVN